MADQRVSQRLPDACATLTIDRRRRPGWLRMLMRCTAIVLTSLSASACGGSGLLSPRSQWGGDFTDRSAPTVECPGGSLSRLRTRMAVSPSYTPATFEVRIPDALRRRLADGDRLHAFHFGTDPGATDVWGFSGYLVSRGNCIVHAAITSHDN